MKLADFEDVSGFDGSAVDVLSRVPAARRRPEANRPELALKLYRYLVAERFRHATDESG